MGCISSKVLARSVSFHEEKRRGSQRNTNSILEDLIISKNGREQYLALICAANTVASELHSKSFSSNTSSKQVTEAADTKTNDKWEISAEPNQEEEKQTGIDEPRRSKSWHWFPEHIVSSLAEENSSEFEDKYELSSKGTTVGNRSFHTVEEYDALVNRLWLSTSHKYQQGEFDDDNLGNDMEILVSDSVSGTSHHIDVMNSAIKEMQPPCLHDSYPQTDKNMDTGVLNPAAESKVSTSDNYNSSAGQENKGDVSESAVQGGNTSGKGNKRKAVARRLESLKIPSDIECPAIASLREWLPAGGIYSPRSYVTPKFGSYSLKTTTSNANESSMDSIFSPELVSAFEQCLQNLGAEEEDILRQIIENLEEESGGDLQSQERTSPCKEG